MADFDDIRIVDIDEKLTRQSDPDRKAIFDVYLTLSAAPPAEWAQYFDARWQMKIYSMKRRAQVSGRYIVIRCVPDELPKYHMAELKAVVAEANAAYRNFFDAQRAAATAKADEEAKNKQAIQDLKSRMKFD